MRGRPATSAWRRVPDRAARRSRGVRDRRAEGHAGRDPRRRGAAARGRSCSGTSGRSTRCSSSSTASRARVFPRTTSRRSGSSCSSPTATTSSGASSASPSRRSRASSAAAGGDASSSSVLAHVDAGGDAGRAGQTSCRQELEPLTTKPLLAIVNGTDGIDLKLEAELAELPAEEAAAFREGESALGRGRAPAERGARPDQLLHRRGEGDAGLDAAPRAARRSTRPRRSTRTSRAASSAAR